MKNDNPPPPRDVCTIPDYVLGKLLFYDELTDNNCRWVVYDGAQKVRCATRRDALDYIQRRVTESSGEVQRLALSARVHIQKALEELDRAAMKATEDSLVLARLSARLRPFVVELDNITLYNYGKNKKKEGEPTPTCNNGSLAKEHAWDYDRQCE